MVIYLNWGLNCTQYAHKKCKVKKKIKVINFNNDHANAISESFSPPFRSLQVFFHFSLSIGAQQIFIPYDKTVLQASLN